MDRSYLILLFAATLFLVMIGWGLYGRLTAPPPAPATMPASQPLVDRLRDERERRMRERGGLAEPATNPSTAPAGD
ncbi:MAG: hypothetical protein M3478_01325 [Planctomycetota bacterium]|nr:hypothetical protein [Planctomycetota bacterium]